jgi:hypothetical protein
MQASQVNCRFVQPFVDVKTLKVEMITDQDLKRNAQVFSVTLDGPTTEIELPWIPSSPEWVEIWQDGFRVVNQTLDFGETRVYKVEDHIITFMEPIEGFIKVVAEQEFYYNMDESYFVRVSNEQGAKTKNTTPGQAKVAYNCEPIILTEPLYGEAMLTPDRKSILYIPGYNFIGDDAFSYTVITDRGQIAEPKCVNINIFDPNPPELDPEGDDDEDGIKNSEDPDWLAEHPDWTPEEDTGE